MAFRVAWTPALCLLLQYFRRPSRTSMITISIGQSSCVPSLYSIARCRAK